MVVCGRGDSRMEIEKPQESSQFSPRRMLRILMRVSGCCCSMVDNRTFVAAAIRLIDDKVADCHTRNVLSQRYSRQTSLL